jgi:hypothetical protein
MATLPMLVVCCVCKQVADEMSPSSGWTPMSSYLDQHHLQSADVRLSHTYCPVCYERQARAWSIPRKIRSSRTARLGR